MARNSTPWARSGARTSGTYTPCDPGPRGGRAEARHPQGLPRGADAPLVRGRRPPRAPRLRPRLPRHGGRRSHRARLDPSSPGDPALRAGRAVRHGHHRPGLDRRDRSRRRGADDALVRSLRNRTRDAGGARRAERAPANSAKEIPPGTRISTEFLKLTERYFDELGDPGEGRVVLRRHRGEGARDRRRDRGHHRDRATRSAPTG